MTRKFLSDNEIVELVINLSDLEDKSEELVCCNYNDVFSGSLISFLCMKIEILNFLFIKLRNLEASIFLPFLSIKRIGVSSDVLGR